MPERFDIVRVLFPFSDLPKAKHRPAVILSSQEHFGADAGHTVLAMITSAEHSTFPLDTPITNPTSAGLPKHCIIRMKLFTLDNRLITDTAGRLDNSDQLALKQNLEKLFSGT